MQKIITCTQIIQNELYIHTKELRKTYTQIVQKEHIYEIFASI